MSRLTASRAAFDLIASFEGFRTRAVLALDGQWTLGFGHTVTARAGLTVTRSEAEDLLRWDLLPIEDTLRQIALTPLSQNQFDALVSFAFNIGIENFRHSDVLKFLNQGQPIAAALSMHAWRRAAVNGRVLTIDALVRRRAAESAMFLETTGARPAAPTSIIRPQIDGTAALVSHSSEPAEADGVADVDLNKPQADPQSAQELAIEQVPTVTVAEVAPQDVLVGGPVVLPAVTIPPLPDKPELTVTTNLANRTDASSVPIVPVSLSPFPGSPAYKPANGVNDAMLAPANDGIRTRLHNAPEMLEDIALSNGVAVQRSAQGSVGFSILVWALIALGAGLLAFGLYYSWKSGILTVATPRRDPSISELSALMAAASGFIILVTSAVSAFAATRTEA